MSLVLSSNPNRDLLECRVMAASFSKSSWSKGEEHCQYLRTIIILSGDAVNIQEITDREGEQERSSESLLGVFIGRASCLARGPKARHTSV